MITHTICSQSHSFCIMRFPGESCLYCHGFREAHSDNELSNNKRSNTHFIIKGYNQESSPILLPCSFTLKQYSELNSDDFSRMSDISLENERTPSVPGFSAISTTAEEHREIVNVCIEHLRSLNNDDVDRKIVLARTVISDMSVKTLYNKITSLLENRPDALIFFISTPLTGTWLGATPEILLQFENERLISMALAGTRTLSQNEIEWDQKNIVEQQIVTQEIVNTFITHHLDPQVTNPFTHQAGNVEHICSIITSKTCNLNAEQIIDLASELSPTPALCGYPRDMAYTYINSHENCDRELYGGYIGLIEESDGKARIYANLRSGRYNAVTEQIRAYVGGGITPMSDPDEEVAETDRKLKWLS